MATKQRLDTVLAQRGLFPSRTRAAASVMAGEVRVGESGRRAEKPGEMVALDVPLTVDAAQSYVSRGGVKLANALAAADVTVEGRRAIEIGTGEILREGGAGGDVGARVALVGYGTGVGKALEAADLLAERGVPATVADARFAKPIDAALMAQLAAEHDLLVTVEEGVLAGGFGTAVWETLNEAGAVGGRARIMRVGLPDRYVTHGKPALLHEEVGFTGQRIAERVEAAMLDRSSEPVGA